MFKPFFDLVAVPSGVVFDDGFNDELIRRGGDITLILILERKPWAPIERSATTSKGTIVAALVVGCEGECIIHGGVGKSRGISQHMSSALFPPP